MTRTDFRRLPDVARGQGGLVTTEQLRAAGVSRRSRDWPQVLPGVHAAAVLHVDRALLESAAMLWAPSGQLSHFSAARRAGIWVPDDDRAWLAVPFEARQRSRRGIAVVRTRHPVGPAGAGKVRWTPPARTLVDLAQVLSARQLNAALLSAVRGSLASAAEVLAATEGLQGRAGLRLIREVCALWTPERESLLEDELHRDVLAVTDGAVRRQLRVYDRGGRLLGRADVGIEDLRLAFEADGLLYHSTDAQISADQRRDRRFLGAGWQTVRFREGAKEDRALVRRDLSEIIAERRRQLGLAA